MATQTQILPKSLPSFFKDFVRNPVQSCFKPVGRWLDQVEIHSLSQAHWLCRVIPAQCPFERDVVWFGHTIAHIPPLCHLNPVYEELMGLRFRALSYLVERGEDVNAYIRSQDFPND